MGQTYSFSFIKCLGTKWPFLDYSCFSLKYLFTYMNFSGKTFPIPGDLERLRRFWLTGTCNPKKEEKRSSEPLAPEQFLSAFFILMCGAALAAGLCCLEHVYFNYLRPSIHKQDTAGCCALISLVRHVLNYYSYFANWSKLKWKVSQNQKNNKFASVLSVS